MVVFLLSILVLAIGLLVVSKLPFGVEIDSPVTALIGGGIIGLLTSIVSSFPLSGFFRVISFGLIPLISATVIFGLAAVLLDGFRLKWGIWSALLGAISLAVVSSILRAILSAVGLL
ncbi:phage holin family protein [Leptolyngbya sp. PCC 6406]|uniref:phage holin family protein n=1 Tax=Leptolyngbya sp. PCC 6406 TaxID=1173264 RepID=UPI0002ABB4E5|nr:phage holin family protein [Leptolyngbya sp. PCC 6406]